MKTTIDIADPLLDEARKVAARERTTVRALVEEGLRHVLETRKRGGAGFKLKPASVPGHGLQAEAAGWSWGQIRDAVYEGRGS